MPSVFRGIADYLLARDRVNVIAVDWTDRGDYMLLQASLIFRKRSVPLAWRFVWKWQYEKSQNDEEEALVEQLIQAVGTHSWVLLADRGFARADFFRWLDERGVKFVIRVSGQVFVEHLWFTGMIDNIPRRAKGGWMYKGVKYRKHNPVEVNLVCHHKEPAPEPWYLVTNLDITDQKAASFYSKRMGIEEGFRDCKSGLGLKRLWLGGPERMDRAMILIALAVLLAALTATTSLRRGDQLHLANNKRHGPVLGFFVLGLRIIEQYPDLLSTCRSHLHVA